MLWSQRPSTPTELAQTVRCESCNRIYPDHAQWCLKGHQGGPSLKAVLSYWEAVLAGIEARGFLLEDRPRRRRG